MESQKVLQERVLANESEKNKIGQTHSEQLLAIFQAWQREREDFLRAERESISRLHALELNAASGRSGGASLGAGQELLAASMKQELAASKVQVELLATSLKEAKRNQAEYEQVLRAVEENLRMELLSLRDASDQKDAESRKLIARSNEMASDFSLKLSLASERLATLRAQMRHEVRSLAQTAHIHGSGQLRWNSDCSVTIEDKVDRLSLNEAPVELTLDELLEPDGAEFIDKVYRKILGRKPDVGAESSYLRQLEEGVSKRQIVVDIRFSGEGRKRGVSIVGLEDLAFMLVEAAPTIEELVSHSGAAFICCAYKTILGRMPDSKGFQFYASRLRSGVSKYDVIAELKCSEEGMRRDDTCMGLMPKVRSYRLSRIRFFGRLLRVLLRVEGDSAEELQARSLEYTLAEQKAIQELQLAAYRRRLQAFVGQVTNAEAQVGSLAKVIGEESPFLGNAATSQLRVPAAKSRFLLHGGSSEEVITELRQYLNRSTEAAQLRRK